VPANSVFVPLMIESFGALGTAGPRGVRCVRIEKVCASKGAPKSVVKAYWRQRFALALYSSGTRWLAFGSVRNGQCGS
jgi:hypothetical protein